MIREEQVRLRAVVDEDDGFLCSVYASTRAEEMARVPWTPQQKDMFVKMQYMAQKQHYAAMYPRARHEIIYIEQAGIEQAGIEQTRSEQAGIEQAGIEQAGIEQTAGEAAVGSATAMKQTAVEQPVEQMPAGQTPPGSTPVGRIYVDRSAEQLHILDMTVLPQYRGQGAGEALLRRLMNEAGASGKAVTIYVETFSPALRLFERLGFQRAGEEGYQFLMKWQAR